MPSSHFPITLATLTSNSNVYKLSCVLFRRKFETAVEGITIDQITRTLEKNERNESVVNISNESTRIFKVLKIIPLVDLVEVEAVTLSESTIEPGTGRDDDFDVD